MSYQQKEKPCNKGCGINIHFDNAVRSGNGKVIPLESDGQSHQCPNDDYNRKQGFGTSSTPPNTNGQQKSFQGTNYTLKQPQQQSPDTITDLAASLQALHQNVDSLQMKVDKLLEVHTVTSTVNFRKADTMKNDQGNEISGSDAASGVPDPHGIINAQIQDDEETAFNKEILRE